MKTELLKYIICPVTKEDFIMHVFESQEEVDVLGNKITDVISGVLVTPSGNIYPIIESIPRLIEGAFHFYSDFCNKWASQIKINNIPKRGLTEQPSTYFTTYILPTLNAFEKEWNNHALTGKTWGMNQETRLDHFLKYMNWSKEEAKNKLVLDAGAGTGQLTSSIATLGCTVIGAELSPAIVNGWRQRKKYAKEFYTKVHMVQANLLFPPFKEKIFDGVHSSGVLHHMPNTFEGFKTHAPLVKTGGSFFVHLYKETLHPIPLLPWIKSSLVTIDVDTLRKYTTKMSPSFLYKLVFIYAAIFHVFYTISATIKGKKHGQTVKERVTSLFDALVPPFKWYHTPEEVSIWYKQFGYKNVMNTDTYDVIECGFNLTGIKG